jgi:hypothetical protein
MEGRIFSVGRLFRDGGDWWRVEAVKKALLKKQVECHSSATATELSSRLKLSATDSLNVVL